MRDLRLMHDWQCHPIWETHPDGRLENLDPSALPIPEPLAEAIRQWAAQFEATFDPEYPPDSGFDDPDEERQWDQQGRQHWRALREALGDQARVRYFSVVSSSYEDP